MEGKDGREVERGGTKTFNRKNMGGEEKGLGGDPVSGNLGWRGREGEGTSRTEGRRQIEEERARGGMGGGAT